MVTRRGRGRGDAHHQKRPSRNRDTPGKSLPGTRRRSTVNRPEESARLRAKEVKLNAVDSDSPEDEIDSSTRFIVRKSTRLQNAAGGARTRPRRSTRPTRPISRYQASYVLDAVHRNGSDSVLNKMEDARKRRRLSNSSQGKIFSKAQRRKTPPQRGLSDSDNGGDDEDSRPDAATDDDNNSVSSSNQTTDSRLSRAWSLSSDSLTGLFRIGSPAPGPGPGLNSGRGAFRNTRTPWSSPSDVDSDEEDSGGVPGRDKMSGGAGLADIDPMSIDLTVGFDSIGGLSGHISALKEMVVFPLLYPEVFDNFKIQPPRGCLFYGPPGTGKTLVARALANECSSGCRKVSFFMRKGADCLSKWVGESERQLRLLFEQAYQMRPSIIFFDEIDGLAPVRSSRQDQIHSSIVSTLLALMDGLDSRGEVVVIGATNRLDSIDPALRRPGRFDREFLFGLPDRESRKEILKIHTRQWKPPPSEDFLDQLAEKCVGYCGADIRAVCTEAALCALRRRYPQIYGTSQKLLLDVSSIAVRSCDFVAALRKMSPAAHRLAASPAKPLTPVVQPLLGAALHDVLQALQRLFPHAEQGMRKRREPDLTSGVLDDGLSGADEGSASSISTPGADKSRSFLHFARSAVKQPTSYRPRMLLAGRPGSGQTSHLAPAVLHALERLPVHSLDSAVLFGASSTAPEEACAQVFLQAQRTSPSILYVPHVQQWWDTAGPSLRASFCSLLAAIPSFCPILLLATCSLPRHDLDPEIQTLFRDEYGEVYTISAPTRQERTNFFQDLILDQAAEAPPSSGKSGTQAVEVLPVAPLPAPRRLSEQERLRLEEQEEDVLRELRLFLRNVTERLSLDRRFKAFSKPVDIEEVPDYLLVVRRPMDLSTLLSNIDEHQYLTAAEFLSDADLIWQNALEYNPDSDPMDRHIRHRACALKDTIRAIIRDELDQDFERVCEGIRESRIRRASSHGNDSEVDGVCGSASTTNSPGRQFKAQRKKRCKRRRKSRWSAGVLSRRRKQKPSSCSSRCSSSVQFSSSSPSESSDGERTPPTAAMNGHHHPPTPRQNGVLTNGCHRPDNGVRRRRLNLRKRSLTSKPPPKRPPALNGVGPRKIGQRKRTETQITLLARDQTVDHLDGETPELVVDRSKLKDLLTRVVVKTEGAEVEPLEKLYALLAQSIYRHRNNYDKTELVQEMTKEINNFS